MRAVLHPQGYEHVNKTKHTMLRPLALSLHLAFLGTVAASAMLPGAVHAQEATTDFAIPAGPLQAALASFSAQTKINVSYAPVTVSGDQHSPGVQGRHTAEQALNQLLSGSGLIAVRQGNGFTLEKISAGNGETTLAPVMVTSQVGEITEGTGSYTSGATRTATRMALSLRETPQSVSVVTRQHIEDFGLQSIEDVAQNTTGLHVFQEQAGRPIFYSRGFTVSNIALDGSPLTFGGYSTDTTGTGTLAVYDRVEILRGASGLLTGTGNPSAVLNLVRKRPTEETRVSLEGGVGRWNNKSVEADAGGAINDAGTLRVRTVASLEDGDTFLDGNKNRRGLLYAIAEADLSPATKLSFGGYYNTEDNPGARSFFLYNLDGSPMALPRSYNNSDDWARWDKENLHAFAELEQRLSGGWKGKLSYQYFNSKMDAQFSPSSRIGATDDFLRGNVTKFLYDHRHHALDVSASGPFTLGGRTHELVLGAGISRLTQHNDGYRAPYSLIYNPLTWDRTGTPPPDEDSFAYYWGQANEIKRQNLYATTRLSLTDSLTAILGARLDWYDYDALNTMTNARTNYRVSHEFTPYAGLVYDLDAQHSLYASIASVFNPQSARDRDGKLLDPVTGTNVEAGIKGEYFGGAVNVSAAVFQIRQKNLARSLAMEECNGQPSCSEAAGEVKSHGFEFEVAGAITPAWNVQAGLSYTTAEYASSTSAATPPGTPYNTSTPKRLLRLSTTYRLSGPLQAWRVGASLQSQSSIYSTNTWPYSGTLLRHGGATTAGLMAAYSVNRHLEMRLNISNLSDKHYFQSIGNYGEPRNVRLSAKYSF